MRKNNLNNVLDYSFDLGTSFLLLVALGTGLLYNRLRSASLIFLHRDRLSGVS